MISVTTIDMSFLHQLLEHYRFTLKDLEARKASGSFVALKRPDGLEDFENVVSRIQKAISMKEKVVLYGDYDVDGLTATAILSMALDELGLRHGFFIPSRYVEGYGLSESRVREFHEKGYHLIICLDNGVAQNAACKLAHDLSMEVLVIDHHEIPEPHADYDYLFHQKQSGFLDYNCSAASLSYFVSSKLLGRDEPYFAVLAGMAVFSDVMPVFGNNLTFAKLMLSFLNRYRYSNLVYLLDRKDFSYGDVSFYLIPSLNSVGRIRKDSVSTNNVCRFLIDRDDKAKIEKRGKDILSCNAERKEIVRNMHFHDSMESEHFLSCVCDSYSGLTGLFANRILREKAKPIAVFCSDIQNQDQYVASLRLPKGYHALDILKKYQSYFIHSGGHDQACGFSILKKDYYLVSTLLASEFAKQSFDVSNEEPIIEITLDDLTEENYHILESFMPFGEDFQQPLFSCSVEKSAFQVVPSSKYAYALTADGKGRVILFQSLDTLQKDVSYFEVVGNFEKTEYKNSVFYQITAKKLTPVD